MKNKINGIRIIYVDYDAFKVAFIPLTKVLYYDRETAYLLDFDDIRIKYESLKTAEEKGRFLDDLIKDGLEAKIKLFKH